MPAQLSALPLRRQAAVKRSLADDPIEAICRKLGCSRSWLEKVEGRWRREVPTPQEAASSHQAMGPEASGVEPRMMVRVLSDLGSARQTTMNAHMSTSEHLSNKSISYGIRL